MLRFFYEIPFFNVVCFTLLITTTIVVMGTGYSQISIIVWIVTDVAIIAAFFIRKGRKISKQQTQRDREIDETYDTVQEIRERDRRAIDESVSTHGVIEIEKREIDSDVSSEDVSPYLTGERRKHEDNYNFETQ